jgi:hypothetical protein
MRTGMAAAMVFVVSAACAQCVFAATYKWVDERGIVQYSDRLPPAASKAGATRISNSGVTMIMSEGRQHQAEGRLSAEEMEQKKAEAKRQLNRHRRDAALIATYANEGEIEAARERELKRHQETLNVMTAGLAASDGAEAKRKLDALLLRGQRETDAINKKFDAQKARFRELMGSSARSQEGGTKPEQLTLMP